MTKKCQNGRAILASWVLLFLALIHLSSSSLASSISNHNHNNKRDQRLLQGTSGGAYVVTTTVIHRDDSDSTLPERGVTTAPSTSTPAPGPNYFFMFPPTSSRPTGRPTVWSTSPPTNMPTNPPTSKPTSEPTSTQPTIKPTTSKPTSSPTSEPTSFQPTNEPTSSPTSKPTREPTSFQPTNEPTSSPTSKPTREPTSFQPTSKPTTSKPTSSPTTSTPTSKPTNKPTANNNSNNVDDRQDDTEVGDVLDLFKAQYTESAGLSPAPSEAPTEAPTEQPTELREEEEEEAVTPQNSTQGPVEEAAVAEDQPAQHTGRIYRFAVVPKYTDNTFFQQVREGCEHQAQLLTEQLRDQQVGQGDDDTSGEITVECMFVGPYSEQDDDGTAQFNLVKELLWGIETPVDQNSDLIAIEDEQAKEDEAWEQAESDIGLLDGIGNFTTLRQQQQAEAAAAAAAAAKKEDSDRSFAREYHVEFPLDGIAVSVQNDALLKPLLAQARRELQIPVVTFDCDVSAADDDDEDHKYSSQYRQRQQEQRAAARNYYIGTDNTFLGRQLARAMESLHPSGGTYGILTQGNSELNMRQRVEGILEELNHANNWHQSWVPLPDSPFDSQRNLTSAMMQLQTWANMNPTVLLSVSAFPMVTIVSDGTNNQSYSPWRNFVNSNQHRKITFLSGDAEALQLEYLSDNLAHGLVGQLPFDMGVKSIDTLFALATKEDSDFELGDPIDDEEYNNDDGDENKAVKRSDNIVTNVISHVQVPVRLPPIDVDHNLIGNLKILGYTLFAIIAAMSIGCAVWAFYYRNVRVVRVAQPSFLIMIALGVLLLSAVMIPLGMDDGGDSVGADDDEHCTAYCMSIPWLASLGFTITFSALYSKTRRVNQIFKSASAFGRVEVKERDVLIPFAVLLTINVIILTCWNIIDPLVYVRESDYGRDGWNRVISTRGSCQSDATGKFLAPLLIVNGLVLLLANWQAYEARDIEAEFAETKYIAITMASLLQALMTGMPVLFVVNDSPKGYYLVATLLTFVVCLVVLLAIFLPKMLFARKYMDMSPADQNKIMSEAISKSARSSYHQQEYSETTGGPSTPFGRLSHRLSGGMQFRGLNSLSTADKAIDDAPEQEVSYDETARGSGMMFVRKSSSIYPDFPSISMDQDVPVDTLHADKNNATIPSLLSSSTSGNRWGNPFSMQNEIIEEEEEEEALSIVEEKQDDLVSMEEVSSIAEEKKDDLVSKEEESAIEESAVEVSLYDAMQTMCLPRQNVVEEETTEISSDPPAVLAKSPTEYVETEIGTEPNQSLQYSNSTSSEDAATTTTYTEEVGATECEDDSAIEIAFDEDDDDDEEEEEEEDDEDEDDAGGGGGVGYGFGKWMASRSVASRSSQRVCRQKQI